MTEYPFNRHKDMVVIYRIGQPRWTAYVGRCTLSEFVSLADFRWNPMTQSWLESEEFATGTSITVLAVMPHETYEEQRLAFDYHAEAELFYQSQVRRVDRPEKTGGRVTRAVRCNETNEEFNSAAAAARHYNVSPSRLSGHLSGTIGYSSVKGHTFTYVD